MATIYDIEPGDTVTLHHCTDDPHTITVFRAEEDNGAMHLTDEERRTHDVHEGDHFHIH